MKLEQGKAPSERDHLAIRPFRPDEREAWLELRQLLHNDVAREDLAREQDDLLAHRERNAVFVAAMRNGELVGFIEASLRDSAPGCTTRPIGFVESWYVRPAHRRARIGRRLVAAAEEWAASLGCTEMASDVENSNETGKFAYAAAGYEPATDDEDATHTVCWRKDIATLDKVVEAWIAAREAERDSVMSGRNAWAAEMVFDWRMACGSESLWQFILRVYWREDVSEDTLSVLAAGPLEDLLACDGPNFIDRVEQLAKSDAKFNWLLGGVWRNSMTDDVWKRVQAVRKEAR
jgi:aminoglycoside 6'-N-acetyltransferase I